MLNGIEVLSESIMNFPNLIFGFIGIGACLGILVVLIMNFEEELSTFAVFIMTIWFCTFLVLGIDCFIDHSDGLSHYTEYKVTISDEVNFKDFNERYEVLSKEGDIYTIRELNEE